MSIHGDCQKIQATRARTNLSKIKVVLLGDRQLDAAMILGRSSSLFLVRYHVNVGHLSLPLLTS